MSVIAAWTGAAKINPGAFMQSELSQQILDLQAGDHLDGEAAALARQAQKMESIGTLAGGIAHDFNNILNIIQGCSALIASHAGENGEIADSLNVINEAIKRGAGVVQQLLTLARKSDSVPETTDVSAVVGGLVELVKGTFPKNSEATMELSPELPPPMAEDSSAPAIEEKDNSAVSVRG
jgi:signal transduction histidine kinase